MKRWFGVALAIGLAACGGGGDGGPADPEESRFPGEWDLQSVNGAPLPYELSPIGSITREVISDRFSVSAGGTFDQNVVLRLTENDQATDETESYRGSYTVSGALVTLIYNDGSTVTAGLSGGTFTVNDGGVSLLYRKR